MSAQDYRIYFPPPSMPEGDYVEFRTSEGKWYHCCGEPLVVSPAFLECTKCLHHYSRDSFPTKLGPVAYPDRFEIFLGLIRDRWERSPTVFSRPLEDFLSWIVSEMDKLPIQPDTAEPRGSQDHVKKGLVVEVQQEGPKR